MTKVKLRTGGDMQALGILDDAVEFVAGWVDEDPNMLEVSADYLKEQALAGLALFAMIAPEHIQEGETHYEIVAGHVRAELIRESDLMIGIVRTLIVNPHPAVRGNGTGQQLVEGICEVISDRADGLPALAIARTTSPGAFPGFTTASAEHAALYPLAGNDDPSKIIIARDIPGNYGQNLPM